MENTLEYIQQEIEEMIDNQKEFTEVGHYTGIDVLESIANNYKKSDDKDNIVLWASSVYNTNDSKEMHSGYDYVVGAFGDFETCLEGKVENKFRISTYLQDANNSEKYKHCSEERFINWMIQQDNTPYFISFTKLIDNLDMWIKPYGKNGKGVCLVFDIEGLKKLHRPSGMFIHGPVSVVYGERLGHLKTKNLFQKMVLYTFLDFIKQVYRLTNLDEIIECKIQAIDQICNIISAYIKDEGWHPEREVRLVAAQHHYPMGEVPIIKYKDEEQKIPYIEIKIPTFCLKKIFVGSQVGKKELKIVKECANILGLSPDNIIISKTPLQ